MKGQSSHLPSLSPGRTHATRTAQSPAKSESTDITRDDLWPSNPHAIKARFAATSLRAAAEADTSQLFAAVYARTRDVAVDATHSPVPLVDASVETESELINNVPNSVTTGTDPDPACGGPLQPTVISVNGSRQGELSVTWKPPAILPAPTSQLSFKIFAKSTVDSFLTKTVLAPWGATSASLRGLAGGHVYAVTVVLVVSETIASAPMLGTFHAFRPPAPPVDVTVQQVPSRGYLEVRWRRPARSAGQAAVTGYTVFAVPDGKPVTLTSPDKTSVFLNTQRGGLKAGRSYMIRISSTSDDADSSVPVSATVLPLAKEERQPHDPRDSEPPPLVPHKRRKGATEEVVTVLYRDYTCCETCGDPISRPYLFCTQHRCDFDGCPFEGPACPKHKCHAGGCARVTVSEKTSYCLVHGCRNPTCFEMASPHSGANYCPAHTCGESDCYESDIGGMDVLAKCCVFHSLARIDTRIKTIIGTAKVDTERNKNVLTDKSRALINSIGAIFAGIDPSLHAITVIGRSNPPEGKDKNNADRRIQWTALAKERADAVVEHLATVCALSNDMTTVGEIAQQREIAFVVTSPVLDRRERQRQTEAAAAAAAEAAAAAAVEGETDEEATDGGGSGEAATPPVQP